MKVCDVYSHHSALEKILEKQSVFAEIKRVLDDSSMGFSKNRPQEIKAKVADGFNRLGWADRVRVSNDSRLTINFLKDRVGICFQLGNIARTYADILKLAVLGKKNIIDVGVIIVPDQIESNKLGANYARYDRLASEMVEFSEIIDVPLLILALSD